MTLNPNFVVAPSLEQYFVDKTTGLPLSGGKVFFYSDVNRSTLKPIYTLSGNPPNYTYVQLPNPSILSSVGTFQDELNNNVLPYYYPFDADGNVELYYIQVFDQDDVPQFDRAGWPNLVNTTPSSSSNLVNFIPNGQFLAHNNINPFDSHKIIDPISNVAPGGWYFRRPTASTSTDFIKFISYNGYVSTPPASPRFSIEVGCSSPNIADPFKTLGVVFPDVNKFASISQFYTFSFYGNTVTSGDFPVNVRIFKHYGTGGSPSPDEIINVTTLNITSTGTQFIVPMIFGINQGKTLGTNSDDYVEIQLSFPTDRTFDGQFTDFLLFTGNLATVEFPQTTNNDFLSRSFIQQIPAYDETSLYLPVVVGLNGYIYDSGQIGTIYAKPNLKFFNKTNPTVSSITNDMYCNGHTYKTNDFSILGIPFSRIQKYLYDPVFDVPQTGTGVDQTTSVVCDSDPSTIFIFNNNFGTVNPVTGFSASLISSTSTNGYGFTSYYQMTDVGYVLNVSTQVGYFPDANLPNVGTSGFTINNLNNPINGSAFFSFQVVVTDASSISPGSYFYFSSLPLFQVYYVWFTIDGIGVDPSPFVGAIGIKVNLLSTYSLKDVAIIVGRAMAGAQNYSLSFPSGNSMSGGESFTYSITNDVNNFYVWYTVDGFGSPPNVPDQYLLNVEIGSTNSSVEIAYKTMQAMNMDTFAAPDLRGLFLRGAGTQPGIQNLDETGRFGNVPFIYGENSALTYQLSDNLSHHHDVLVEEPLGSSKVIFAIDSLPQTPPVLLTGHTEPSGTTESRPINASIYWMIRY